jgi:hypothetical protein
VSVLVLAVWGWSRADPVVTRLGTLWDAHWYLDLARHGYDNGMPPPDATGHRYTNLAFFPLYPALIRLAHAVLPLTTASAALLVAWAAALAAAAGVYATVAAHWGRRTGIVAAALWGALPHSVVMNIAYTEALFSALAAWTLWAAVTRRWVWAGTLSTLSCLTRPTGIALAAAVCAGAAAELLAVYRDRPAEPAEPAGAAERQGLRVRVRGARWARPLGGALLAPLGWFGYIAWVGLRLGHWDAYFDVQLEWDSRFDFGLTTARQLIDMAVHPLDSGVTQAVVAAVLVAAVGLFVRSVRQGQPLPLLVFSLAVLVITLGDAGAYLSRARFLMPVFPLLVPPALALAKSPSWRRPVLVLGAACAVSAGYGLFLVYITQSAL